MSTLLTFSHIGAGGIWIPVLRLAQQAFNPLSHFLSLSSLINLTWVKQLKLLEMVFKYLYINYKNLISPGWLWISSHLNYPSAEITSDVLPHLAYTVLGIKARTSYMLGNSLPSELDLLNSEAIPSTHIFSVPITQGYAVLEFCASVLAFITSYPHSAFCPFISWGAVCS